MERNFIMDNIPAETNTTAPAAETKTVADDLQTRLNQATATKEPGATKTVAPKTSFWNASDDDFEAPAQKTQEPKEKAAEPTKEAKTETEAKPTQLTEKVKSGSAKTAAGMIDFSNRMLLTPIVNFKLKKKLEKGFTDAQLNLIESKLMEADEKSLEAEELRIKRRFDSILTKHQKKVDGLSMSDTEKKELEDAFYNYFDYTQKSLSPGWYIAMAIINSTGSRIVDAFTD